ncbi:hypothetical protein ACQRBF_00010 [Peptoniphilaceae bacterium SGI.131]
MAKRKEIIKEFVIRARVDKTTINKLNYIEKNLGISKSDIIRLGIENQYNNIKSGQNDHMKKG